MKMLCKNMSRATHRHHMAIMYVPFAYWDILSFLLVLKMEYERPMQWACLFNASALELKASTNFYQAQVNDYCGNVSYPFHMLTMLNINSHCDL